jgi:ribosomal protein S18 acetylase RimI-like enzyme
MNKTEFNLAKLKDAGVLLKLIREYYAYDEIPWNRHIPSGLKLFLRNPKYGHAILMKVDQEAAGYLIFTYGFDLEFGGVQVTVTDFYIRPEYRRLGLGKKTLQFFTQFCKSKKIKAIELQAVKSNQKAIAFYRAMGFELYERIPMSKWIE